MNAYEEAGLVRVPPADVPAVIITTEQIDLIKRTIAVDATDAELQLFFFDCQRRGVHPLDKLIHFTKRKGKYTPVTSIDYFRSRAGETGQHMGTDDAIYTGKPGDADFRATVVVYRRVEGDKCAFFGTARFTEFLPEAGSDFMWKKMPFNQIAKCAEAQALRKAFPQLLQGLHIVEEMERETTAVREVKRASQTGNAPVPSPTTKAPTTTKPPLTAGDIPFGR